MAQYPIASKSSDVKLHHCIDLIAKLIRASRGKTLAGAVTSTQSTMDSSATADAASAVHVPIYLKHIDLQAFLGRYELSLFYRYHLITVNFILHCIN